MNTRKLWILLCVLSLASSQTVVTPEHKPVYDCEQVPKEIARHDPCYRWVAKDPYCCEVEWDKTCLEAYNECAYGNWTGNVDGRVFDIEKYRDYIDANKLPLDIYKVDQPTTKIDNVNNYGEMVVGTKIVANKAEQAFIQLDQELDGNAVELENIIIESTLEKKEPEPEKKKESKAGLVLGFFLFLGAAIGL